MEILIFFENIFWHFCHPFFCHEKTFFDPIFFATLTPNLLRNPKIIVRMPKNHDNIVKNADYEKKVIFFSKIKYLRTLLRGATLKSDGQI